MGYYVPSPARAGRLVARPPERVAVGVPVTHPPRITNSVAAGDPLKVVHKGFDGLDVAFLGALRQEDLETLEAARERAEQNFQPALVEIGPGRVAMHIAESGAKGGYRYRGDTGPVGETWFIKHSSDPNKWNIRVSVKSLPLAISGLVAVREELYRKLRDIGVVVLMESIGRIDYAVDFLMRPEFALEPDQFVAHSKTGVAERMGSIPEQKVSPDEIQVQLAGRRTSGVTVGKMPGRQIIVYDKLLEVVKRQKFPWLDIWGIDPRDGHSVWRVELRAGKKLLTHWKLKTFIDLESQIGDLLVHSAQAVRYVASAEIDSNITRRPLHPLWKALQHALVDALAEHRSGILPAQIIEGDSARIHATYIAQIVALFPGALVSSGYSNDEAAQKYPKLMERIVREIKANPKRFREKVALARERLHFFNFCN